MALFLATFGALFSVVNPLGAMPVFVVLTRNDTPEWRLSQLRKASAYLFLILVISFFVGTYILDFFGITIHALRIAGGLIILRSGLALMNSDHARDRSIDRKVRQEAIEKTDISLTPLAMPLLSGPGSMSYMINLGLTELELYEYVLILVAALGVAGVTYAILRVAPMLVTRLGESGLASLSRLMGFLSMAIGIQFIVNGVTPLAQDFFKGQ